MTFPRLAASLALAALLLAGCGGYVDHLADRREARAEAAYPPVGRLVELEDGRVIHALVAGEGPDLVLLHGAGGNLRDFTFSFIDQVSDRYRVIAFDRPGLGHSDRSRPDLAGPFDRRIEDPLDQARMLHEAARELGVERPIVLGHSYGGAVAMAWALLHEPAALVVVSGATQPYVAEPAPLFELGATSLGGALIVPIVTVTTPDRRIERTLELSFAPQSIPAGYPAHIGIPLSLRRDSLRVNLRQIDALPEHLAPMAERYGELTLPIEVVHGAADRVVPPARQAEILAEQVPSARLTLLEGIGHMPHHTAPEAVTEAIDRAARRAGLR